jgi:uncharacterized protein YbaR (Trm112 family)
MPHSLQDILVCPLCQGTLTPVSDTLICKKDQLAFPVRDGIPVLLPKEAQALKEG